MAETLKMAVHQLVEECNDPHSLQEVFDILEASNKGKDWWLTLNQAQQEKTLASIKQASEGNVISHEEVSKRIWKKINQ